MWWKEDGNWNALIDIDTDGSRHVQVAVEFADVDVHDDKVLFEVIEYDHVVQTL